jgi:hypothetical protein
VSPVFVVFMTLFVLLGAFGAYFLTREGRDTMSASQTSNAQPPLVPTPSASGSDEPVVSTADPVAQEAAWVVPKEKQQRYTSALKRARSSPCLQGERDLVQLFLGNPGTPDGWLAAAECAALRSSSTDNKYAREYARRYLRLPGTSSARFTSRLRSLYELKL